MFYLTDRLVHFLFYYVINLKKNNRETGAKKEGEYRAAAACVFWTQKHVNLF